MMSLDTIRSMSRDAAKDARKAGKEPWHPETLEDITLENLRRIPNLGDYTGNHATWHGWKKTDLEWFVDSSGFGTEGEAAMTPQQLVKELRDHFSKNPTAGYGITECGQFQIYIAAFEFVGRGKRAA